jgi:uncharacterized protein (TIGR02646 family)
VIHVRKGRPPPALTTYRKTPDTTTDPPRAAKYDGPGFEAVKQAVRTALHGEQRGLCCYCNDRIEDRDDAMKIEHRVPQHGPDADPTRDLDWPNLLGACRGAKPNPRGRGPNALHCDSSKSDRPLAIDPTDAAHVATISYERSGRIVSNNPRFNDDLDGVLNLNLDALVALRRQALTELQVQLHERHGVSDLPVEKLRKLLDATRDPPGRNLRPFAGYLCAWLERAIDRRTSA